MKSNGKHQNEMESLNFHYMNVPFYNLYLIRKFVHLQLHFHCLTMMHPWHFVHRFFQSVFLPSSALDKWHFKNDFGIILICTSFQTFDNHSTAVNAEALLIYPIGINRVSYFNQAL
jgi:hypothetical protein